MTVRIVLAVRESQYIEPLLHYVQHSEYRDMLRITAFSRMEAFLEFMKGEERPDAIVGDSAFVEAWLVEGRHSVPWAVLSGEGEITGIDNKSLSGGQVIAKYQSLPSLLTSILHLCEAQHNRSSSVPKGETLLLGVVSASGSSGKTVISLNMAKQLGELGLSVFYLNLESVDSSSLYVRSPGGSVPGLERLLYEIQAGRDMEAGVRGNAQSYAMRYENLRCEAFSPVSNVKEMLQMSRRDTLDLLDLLASEGRYDIVIVDTGSIGEERADAVMHRCGVLVWVLRDEDVSIYKTERWLSHYLSPHSGMPPELIERSRFVLNQCAGTSGERNLPEGMPCEAVLPNIPSWTLPYHGELCLNSPQFQQNISELCKAILEPVYPGLLAMERSV